MDIYIHYCATIEHLRWIIIDYEKKKSKEERERARRNLAFFFLASFHLPFPGLEKKKKIMDSINGNDNQVSSYQNNSKINDHLKSTYISSNHTIDNNISGKGSI